MLYLYLETNPYKVKFLEKKTLVASYSRDLVAHPITQNLDSNYMPKEGHKNGSQTYRSRIWF